MKEQPNIIPYKTWLDNLTVKDICELLNITEEEYFNPDELEVECPSCEGDGHIEFDHSFSSSNGTIYETYQCDCKYCDGYGTIDGATYEDKLPEIYSRLVLDDKLKYSNYIKCK